MESNMSRLESRKSRLRFVFEDLESSRHASRPLETRLEEQCHREYVKSLVEGQRSGVRSGVGIVRCKFRHHEESRPAHISKQVEDPTVILTLMAECKDRAISLSCSSLGLLPKISGNQN
jgi:hypothetical protein